MRNSRPARSIKAPRASTQRGPCACRVRASGYPASRQVKARGKWGRAEDLFARLEAGGVAYVDELIATRKSEELFLDLKRSANNGAEARLNDNDRNNLAVAISGFGNSEGGVIVWGVDCARDPEMGDVARAKVPVANATRFVSLLEGAVSGCTLPPHNLVRSIGILEPGSDNGFIATIIPKSSSAPHQVVGSGRYYIQAELDRRPK